MIKVTVERLCLPSGRAKYGCACACACAFYVGTCMERTCVYSFRDASEQTEWVINGSDSGPSTEGLGRAPDKLPSHAPRKAGCQQPAQPTAAMGIQALWFCQVSPISGGGGCTCVGPWAATMGDDSRCPETCLHTGAFQALPPCAQRGRQWGRRMGTGGTVRVWGALQV